MDAHDSPSSATPVDSLVTLAVLSGLITEAQLAEADSLRAKFHADGVPMSLMELLIKKRWLTQDQVAELKKQQQQALIKVVVPGYEIVSKLGQGATAAVLKARHAKMGHFVAIKLLLPSVAKDPSFVERFMREARASAQVRHPNIIQGVDVGTSNGINYLVMEFVEGRTLSKILDSDGPFQEPDVIDIAIQISSALVAIHAAGLIHRDIKPSNILLDQHGLARLCDLGSVRLTANDAHLTMAGTAVGTPHYMAPEQAQGKPEVDIRADIYSLGATLYRLLTNKTLFTGDNSSHVMAALISEDATKKIDNTLPVSEGLRGVLRKMLARNPKDRYQLPKDLMQDLQLLRDGRVLATSAHPNRRVASGPANFGPAKQNSRKPTDRHEAVSAARTGQAIANTRVRERSSEPEGRAQTSKINWAIGIFVTAIAVSLFLAIGTGSSRQEPHEQAAAKTSAAPEILKKSGPPLHQDNTAAATGIQEGPQPQATPVVEQPPEVDESSTGTIDQRYMFNMRQGEEAIAKADWARARQTFVRALELRPDDTVALGRLRVATNRNTTASAELSPKERSEGLRSALENGRQALAKFNFPAARTFLRQAKEYELQTSEFLQLSKDIETETDNFARLGEWRKSVNDHLQESRFEEALAVAVQAYKTLPKHPEALDLLVRAQNAAGDQRYADAYKEMDPQKHRAQLIRAAQAGKVEAAARMIELQMLDELRQLDITLLKHWKDKPQLIGNMSPRQIFAVILARHAGKAPSISQDDRLRFQKESVDLLKSTDIKSPFIGGELARLLRLTMPADKAQADRIIAGFLREALSIKTDGSDRLRVASMVYWSAVHSMPTNYTAGSWKEATRLLDQAQELFNSRGDKFGLALCRAAYADCRNPVLNPSGDWQEAGRLYGEAAEMFKTLNSGSRFIDAKIQQATCLRTDPPARSAIYTEVASAQEQMDDLDGAFASLIKAAEDVRPDLVKESDWMAVKRLYERAATLAVPAPTKVAAGHALMRAAEPHASKKDRVGMCTAANLYGYAATFLRKTDQKSTLADCLMSQALCANPTTNVEGSWTVARKAYSEACDIFLELNNTASAASARYGQADCSIPPNDPSTSWKQAAEIYREAAELAEKSNSKVVRGWCLYQQGLCVRPDKNTLGNWSDAAKFYAQAVDVMREAGDKRGIATCLMEQAWCVNPQNNTGGDWQSSTALYEQAERICADIGDKQMLASCLFMEAMCSIQGKKENLTPAAVALFQRAAKLHRELGDENAALNVETWTR